MVGTTFPLITAGWRAAVGWLPETIYGVAPISVKYNWVGAVQNAHGTIDKNPIFVYRMDGATDYPAYILKGQRNVDFVITYWPQDVLILNDMIDKIGTTNAVSHAFILKNLDTGTTYTVTGAMASSVRVNGKTGLALEVEVTYWCQNIMLGNPYGATYSTDPGILDSTNVPFFFSQESVQVPSGTPQPQSLTFSGTITNNLSRVPMFGTDVIRSIPTLTRKADGVLTATFATLSDYPNEVNILNIQGTTTAGTIATVLTDSNQNFGVNALVGMTLTYFTGPAAGEKQIIVSNTATTITTLAFSPAPNGSGDTYLVDLDVTAGLPNASGLAQQTIRLKLGVKSSSSTNYYLDYTGAVLPKIDLTTPIADLVALSLDWTGTGASAHT